MSLYSRKACHDYLCKRKFHQYKLERRELCCILKLKMKEICYTLKAIGKSWSEQGDFMHGRKICFNESRNRLIRDSAVGLDGHFSWCHRSKSKTEVEKVWVLIKNNWGSVTLSLLKYLHIRRQLLYKICYAGIFKHMPYHLFITLLWFSREKRITEFAMLTESKVHFAMEIIPKQ